MSARKRDRPEARGRARGEGGRSVTIYRIAREAGVSVSTVSRVLTGAARVSEGKRLAVEAVINRHGFRPNAMARNLGRRQSLVIGFILPDVTHPFYGAAFLGAESRALELGYSLLLGNTMNDNIRHVTNVESRLLSIMLEKQVDGIIMMGGRVNETRVIPEHLEEMQRVMAQVPIVIAGGRMKGVDCWSISLDEAHGVGLAVNYLAALGHQDLGFLGGIRGIEPTDSRMEGFRRGLADHGMRVNPDWFVESGFTIEDGRSAMEAFLLMRDRPTALVCFNDLTAVGALYAARKNGLRVPEELSIIGVDNIPLSEYVVPRLTSIDLDARQQGVKAVNVMVEILEKKSPRRNFVLQPRLVIRDSCYTRKAAAV
jgi:DNA-binding LacI/PurR family transcriptional regulator